MKINFPTSLTFISFETLGRSQIRPMMKYSAGD